MLILCIVEDKDLIAEGLACDIPVTSSFGRKGIQKMEVATPLDTERNLNSLFMPIRGRTEAMKKIRVHDSHCDWFYLIAVLKTALFLCTARHLVERVSKL